MIKIIIGTLGALFGISVGVNVFQATENRNLRQQIAVLEEILSHLNSDIEELKKQQKAIKNWAFYKAEEIQKLNKQIMEYVVLVNYYEMLYKDLLKKIA